MAVMRGWLVGRLQTGPTMAAALAAGIDTHIPIGEIRIEKLVEFVDQHWP
jgi:hypothetical protein